MRPGSDVPSDLGGSSVAVESAVGGYRLVRILEDSPESTTWLAIAATEVHTAGSIPAGVRASHPQPLVKTDRRAVEVTRYSDSPSCHIPEAALAVVSPHVHGALDLATDATGRVILIAERTVCTLAALLNERSTLRPGEAVTILAPAAAGLSAMHRVGFVHGSLTTDAVAFAPDGRPVLCRLAERSSRMPAGEQGAILRRTDLLALRALIDDVFRHCDAHDDDAIGSLLRWADRTIGTPDDGETFFAQLDLRLFAFADPVPLDLGEGPEGAAHENVGLTVPRAPEAPRRQQSTVPEPGGWVSRVLTGTGIDSIADVVDRGFIVQVLRGRMAGLGGWARRALRGRATVIVISTLVAVVGVWGGLALVPDDGPAANEATQAPDELRAPAEASETTTPTEASQAESAALAGDDPSAALAALLALRSRCLATGRTECVRLVDEQGSAAEATDLHAIHTNGIAPLQGPFGVESPLGTTTVETAELVQHTGHAVLFRLKDPAHTANQPMLVLLMKTGTGWRLRDLSEPD